MQKYNCVRTFVRNADFLVLIYLQGGSK